MSLSLRSFDLHAMLRCGAGIRQSTRRASSTEEAAGAVVRYLYDEFQDPGTAARECALVRLYMTYPFGQLPASRQLFAQRLLGRAPASPDMRCLVLMATAGELPEWNSPARSRHHLAIPLPSVEIVEQAPMIAQLVRQMGMDMHDLVRPQPGLLQSARKTFNVFYVAEAKGSPYIPAQADFVDAFGIRSVVGFGGLLPSGEVFSVILFARVPVPEPAAQRFRNVALDLRVAITDLGTGHVFATMPGAAEAR